MLTGAKLMSPSLFLFFINSPASAGDCHRAVNNSIDGLPRRPAACYYNHHTSNKAAIVSRPGIQTLPLGGASRGEYRAFLPLIHVICPATSNIATSTNLIIGCLPFSSRPPRGPRNAPPGALTVTLGDGGRCARALTLGTHVFGRVREPSC